MSETRSVSTQDLPAVAQPQEARRRLDLRILALLAGIFLAVWGFVELADEVMEGSTHALDSDIILAMRTAADPADPIGPGWLEEMARDATALGGIFFVVFVSLSAVIYLLLRRLHWSCLYLVISVLGGWGISTALKTFFDRPRPQLVPHESIVYSASFPSGHSTISTVIYLTLAALLMNTPRHQHIRYFLLSVAVITCILVGVSRVYLGVHWPTDVLAGWTVGAVWATLCYLVVARSHLRARVTDDHRVHTK